MMMLLHTIQSRHPAEPRLLDARMNALCLDIGAWRRFEPTLVAELRDVCSACQHTEQCELDLTLHSDDPDWRDWKDYCSNAGKLNMLVALQCY